jgi:hypothetical protein
MPLEIWWPLRWRRVFDVLHEELSIPLEVAVKTDNSLTH